MSVLSNFLCTFVLTIVKPFWVGDVIELVLSAVQGKVIDMSFVVTTLEIAPGETVMIPNSLFRDHLNTGRVT